MKKNLMFTAPKISRAKLKVGENEVALKIVRNSKICRFLTTDATFVFGNTIFVRDKVLIRSILVRALTKLEIQSKIGVLRFCWQQLKNRTK